MQPKIILNAENISQEFLLNYYLHDLEDAFNETLLCYRYVECESAFHVKRLRMSQG